MIRRLLIAAALCGCSTQQQQPAPPPQQQTAVAQPPPPAEQPITSRAPDDEPVPLEQQAAHPEIFGGPPASADDPSAWTDATTGPLATLVYVSRRKQGDPAALVFSSDPGHSQFQRKNSARVTVVRMKKEEMDRLLRYLDSRGVQRLPWRDQPYDEAIGPERALLRYQGGQRRRVEKDALPESDQALFTEVERLLIQLSMHR